jgi:hypothetical protein
MRCRRQGNVRPAAGGADLRVYRVGGSGFDPYQHFAAAWLGPFDILDLQHLGRPETLDNYRAHPRF